MSVGSRIKELREHKNISRNNLAKLVGVTPGAISNYENGVSSPKETILFKLMEALDCDANYLYQDDMDVKPSIFTTTFAEQDFLTKYRKLDLRAKGAIDTLLEYEYEQFVSAQQCEAQIQSLKEEYKGSLELYMKRVRYAGTANNAPPIPKKDHKMVKINHFEGAYGAGGGQINDSSAGMITIEVPEDDVPEGTDTTMDIAGDSMEPTINHGDCVYIQYTDHLEIGDIGIFYLDGENFIKEYGGDVLISHNPEYDPIQISEFSAFVIQGKVLGKKTDGFIAL